MRLYRDRAIVLRDHRLGEADRIITLLTRDHGLVRAVAKGVRRTRSRFGGRLEPFTHIDVQLYPGRNLDVVTQAQILHAYGDAIVTDYGLYTTASAVLETAERLSGEERVPDRELYQLTFGALHSMATGRHPAALTLDAYLLRAMGGAGWAPALTECARCTAPGPHRAFHVAAGGAVCVHCRPPGAATPDLAAITLMDALLHGRWDEALRADRAMAVQTSGLIAAHLQWHLERRLRTLPLIERVGAAAGADAPVADASAASAGQDGTRDPATTTPATGG